MCKKQTNKTTCIAIIAQFQKFCLFLFKAETIRIIKERVRIFHDSMQKSFHAPEKSKMCILRIETQWTTSNYGKLTKNSTLRYNFAILLARRSQEKYPIRRTSDEQRELGTVTMIQVESVDSIGQLLRKIS